MNLDDIKREREQLERDIAERAAINERFEREKARNDSAEHAENFRTTEAEAQPVVTREVRNSDVVPQQSSAPFTPAKVRFDAQSIIEVIGEALLEERQKAHDALCRLAAELRHGLERKVDDRKLDKVVSELRSEILTERLAHERELRAMEQRYYRGAPSSQPVRDIVGEMIELN